MVFTCFDPGCADSRHSHPVALARRPAKKKALERAAPSTKVVRDPRKGRALRVDIHCHYLNPEAAKKLAHLNSGQHEPSVRFANALTREVNARQMQDRAPKLSTIEVRLKDM